MKKVGLVLVFLLGLMGTNQVKAEDKIAYINMQELAQMLPQWDSALAEMQAHDQRMQTQYNNMQQELQTAQQKFMAAEEAGMDPITREIELQKIEDMTKRLQNFQGLYEQSTMKKQEELLQPIYELAKKAVDEVAKANGYTYVIDSQYLITYPEDRNLMPLVKKHLGIL